MKIKWNSELWLKQVASVTNKEKFDLCQSNVFANTVEIVKDGGYISENGKEVFLPVKPNMEEQGVLYQDKFEMENIPNEFERTNIEVTEDDCLEVAHRLFLSEGSVCVLNNASSRFPGGSVIKGPGAQEEYLCKCSDYYRALFPFGSDIRYRKYTRICRHPSYPLDLNYGCCYVPNVTVFRDKESTGYSLVDIPWQTAIIAIAGINSPECFVKNGERCLTMENEKIIKNKITTLFRVAKHHHQYNIVLTAWGCGAFNNPPKHIAEIFKSIVYSEEFYGYFQNLVFAISKSPQKIDNFNYKTFFNVFNDNVL